MKRSIVCLSCRWLLVLTTAFIAASSCLAGEYIIGAEDVLEVKFWQDPTLNTTVRVNQDGKIALDIVGEIQAAGKTTTQLETDIVRDISRLNKKISQAVVRVTTYNYQYVFVSGQVTLAGKMTFEEIPDLWTIINEAGGITEFGDLNRVTIIRGGEEAGKVEVVNVAEAISNGQLNKLPKIRREDTIDIPRTPVGLPSAELTQQIERKNVIYVLGAVNRPGPVQFEENTDILEALALAGGHTENANLAKVKIISKDGFYAQTFHFDLEKYSQTGAMARYIMRKEDTFIISGKGRGIMEYVLTGSTVVGAVASLLLLYNQVSDER